MRLTSTIAAVAAVAMVQAGPVLDERGTYEQPGVISVGDYFSGTTMTMGMGMPMASPESVTPEAIMANVAPTAASSAATPTRTQYVVVGGTAGLVYTPEFIFAEIGEVIIFHFGTKNHTFTQSTFAQPCVSMSNGMDSGFMPTDGSTTPSFKHTVTTKSPLWFYCKQGNHCKSGMVFAINPATTGDKTFQNYKALAMGGTTTVVETATTSTLVSVTASAPPPPASSPPMMIPGINMATDGQCQCVCNIDIANGVVNPSVQGVGVFGGSVGQVAVPWLNMQAVAAPPPPPGTVVATAGTAPAAADSPPTTATNSAATAIGVVGNSDSVSVNGFQNLGQGTVIPLGGSAGSGGGVTSTVTNAVVSAAAETGTATAAVPSGGFNADGQLGGAQG